jgi:hypothetical protein
MGRLLSDLFFQFNGAIIYEGTLVSSGLLWELNLKIQCDFKTNVREIIFCFVFFLGIQQKVYTVKSGAELYIIADGTSLNNTCNDFTFPEPCILAKSEFTECATKATDNENKMYHSRNISIGINATWGDCLVDDVHYPCDLYLEGVAHHSECLYCDSHNCMGNGRTHFENPDTIFCEKDLCSEELCCKLSCFDEIRNGNETGVDCCGSECDVSNLLLFFVCLFLHLLTSLSLLQSATFLIQKFKTKKNLFQSVSSIRMRFSRFFNSVTFFVKQLLI